MSIKHKIQLIVYLLFWLILSFSLLFGEVKGFGNTPFYIGLLILVSLALVLVKNINCLVVGIIIIHVSSAILLGTIILAALFFFRGNEWAYLSLIFGSMVSFIISFNIYRILRIRFGSNDDLISWFSNVSKNKKRKKIIL